MKNKEPLNGLLTERMDINTLEFNQLKEMIFIHSKSQTNDQKSKIK